MILRTLTQGGLRSLFATLWLSLTAGSAGAATITIINNDGPNEGFNDPTPVAPVGGNPGTTLGAQRLFVFQHAANIWGGLLSSPVEILVNAQMNPQTCDATSGVLGSASAGSSQRNFAGAPHADTWYQQALANSLAGLDLNAAPDMNCTFNVSIGSPTCLPQGWYLGVDGNEGAAIELLPVVLHELGHGLGFATITLAGVEMGTPPSPHVYDRFLLDLTQNMHWHEMTEPQRVASAQNCQNLVWDGPAVIANSASMLGPKPVLRVNSPPTIAGDYNVGLASFGPSLDTPGVTGNLVLVNDGTSVPTNGCEPFVNAAAVNGNVALLDRGGCTFVVKAKNAQLAGALAVVVADSVPGCPALGMSGADPTITIPTVRITTDDGATLKSHLLAGVNVTLRVDPALRAGADAAGRVLVYTPIPFATGSSVSHWDTSPTPNLLMEPAINPDLSSTVDLALHHFVDIGWILNETSSAGAPQTPTTRLQGSYPNPFQASTRIRFSLEREEAVELEVYDIAGRVVKRLARGRLGAGSHALVWDGTDLSGRRAAPGIYHYRLTAGSTTGTGRMALVR
jgi:hypothetical protein